MKRIVVALVLIMSSLFFAAPASADKPDKPDGNGDAAGASNAGAPAAPTKVEPPEQEPPPPDPPAPEAPAADPPDETKTFSSGPGGDEQPSTSNPSAARSSNRGNSEHDNCNAPDRSPRVVTTTGGDDNCDSEVKPKKPHRPAKHCYTNGSDRSNGSKGGPQRISWNAPHDTTKGNGHYGDYGDYKKCHNPRPVKHCHKHGSDKHDNWNRGNSNHNGHHGHYKKCHNSKPHRSECDKKRDSWHSDHKSKSGFSHSSYKGKDKDEHKKWDGKKHKSSKCDDDDKDRPDVHKPEADTSDSDESDSSAPVTTQSLPDTGGNAVTGIAGANGAAGAAGPWLELLVASLMMACVLLVTRRRALISHG